MKKTSLGLKKPEGTDLVNIQDMNDNMDVIEKELKVRVKTTGDIKDTTVTFTQESTRANIATGEKMSAIMGKIKKFFADLTAPAFAQMITTKADLMATKATGYVPDAKAVADAVSEVNGKLSQNKIRIAVIKHTVDNSGNISEVSTYDYDASGIIRTSDYGYIGTNDVIKTAYTYPNYTYYAEVPIIINGALFNKGDVIATKPYNIEYNMLGYY